MKKLVLGILIFWGIISFLLVCCEDEENFAACMLWKGAGLASFLVCMLTGAWLNKKGYLPKL